jgi:hypothetical protein
MKQSTIFWIWLVGGVVWLLTSGLWWGAGHKGHALITIVVAALFFAAALQARRKPQQPL